MRPAVLCALLWVAPSACTAINPAFDEPRPTASVGETSHSTTSPGDGTTQPVDPTTSSASSTSTSTAVDSSGPGDSSSTSSTGPAASTTDDTTTGPTCAPQNEACDQLPCCGECATCSAGVCVLDDALCGTCGVCIAGSCEPAKQNTLCVPEQSDCTNRVWGLQDGVCYATKPAGLCNKDGACVPDCQEQGAVLAMCDPRCVVDGACVSGGDPDKITFDTFCHHQGEPTGTCFPDCNPEGTFLQANACDGSGMCVSLGNFLCEPYVCAGNQCTNNCMSMADCANGHSCINNACI